MLEATSFDILASDNGVEVNSALLRSADLGVGVAIELLALADVEVDGETPSDDKEGKGDNHGVPGADAVGDVAEDDRDDGTARDGGDEERGTALGVATETAETDGEDDGEDTALEEQNNHEKRKTAPVGSGGSARVDTNGGGEEDHDQGLVGQEDPARPQANVHQTGSRETANGEESLCDGVEVGTLLVSLGDGQVGVGLGEVVDEEGRNSALSTNVAELGGDSPEEGVLLLEGLVDVASSVSHHLSLVGHVGVGDLRDRSEVEDHSEDGDERSNAEVDILNAGERPAILTDVLEDDEGGQDRGNDGADSLE